MATLIDDYVLQFSCDVALYDEDDVVVSFNCQQPFSKVDSEYKFPIRNVHVPVHQNGNTMKTSIFSFLNFLNRFGGAVYDFFTVEQEKKVYSCSI